MLDPILRLLVARGRHAPYNSVSTAGRVEHAALRSVVDNGADVCGACAITLLTAEAVRLFHVAAGGQGIGSPLMVIVKENGELRSYGLAPRRNRLFEEAIFHVLRQGHSKCG